MIGLLERGLGLIRGGLGLILIRAILLFSKVRVVLGCPHMRDLFLGVHIRCPCFLETPTWGLSFIIVIIRVPLLWFKL